MCGISGFISFDPDLTGVEERKEILALMSRAIARRGPDDAQFYDDGVLSLVFRRLSIIDVQGGRQPIWNEDNTLMVAVNGEIYNHQELRSGLSSTHDFSTQSDSEVVLHLYEEYGEEGIEKLNGMFAFVLWDKKNKKLILVRDRLGIKPLYYCELENGLVFSSELKALLMHPQCPSELNWADLKQVGIQQKERVSSYMKGIHHLPAGSLLTLSPGERIEIRKYWSIESCMREDERFDSGQKYCETYGRLICDSITRQLMSDVPIGIFLSGGIDSSLIAAVAAQSNKNVHCFTVAERTTVSSGDIQQAIRLCKDLGVTLHAAYMDTSEIARRFRLRDLERMILLMESPRFDPEWLFKYELHKFAKKQVPDIKVILIGQGADEFAGGYSNQMDSGMHDWDEYIESIVAPSIKEFVLANNEIPGRFEPYFEDEHVEWLAKGRLDNYRTEMRLLVNQLQYFNLWHEDRTSSYNGLETRVPYLDHRLVELLASIPESLHCELFWDKKIVREALYKQVSTYPKDKEKVPFFSIQDDSSIDELVYLTARNIYPDFKEKYLQRDRTIFDWQRVDDLYERVCSRSGDFIFFSWKIIEIMAVSIFDDLFGNKEKILSLVEERDEAVVRSLTDEELNDIEALKFSTPSHRAVCHWTMETRVIAPARGRLLTSLADPGQAHSIVLLEEGNLKQDLSIPPEDGWAVDMLGYLCSKGTVGDRVSGLSVKYNIEPGRMVQILEFLRAKGFVDLA